MRLRTWWLLAHLVLSSERRWAARPSSPSPPAGGCRSTPNRRCPTPGGCKPARGRSGGEQAGTLLRKERGSCYEVFYCIKEACLLYRLASRSEQLASRSAKRWGPKPLRSLPGAPPGLPWVPPPGHPAYPAASL